MIKKNFGETIDIHGGGQDLIFPHHENEIAQSKCAHGGRNLANYWLHNGYLTVSGEKMSKSQGNFVTVHDLLKEFIGGGEDIRLCLLTAQYRQPVDFSRDGVIQAKKQLDKWYKITQGVEPTVVSDAVLDALRDDLNTPKAIMALNQLSKNENRKGELLASAQLLGLLESTIEKRLMGSLKINPEKIEDKILERTIAKMDKNWKRADEIRDELNKSGIKLLDRPDGTTAWE